MRDDGFIYVAGHPLLNRRCTRLPGCIRLRNDLYCVEWGVKLYSLTQQPGTRTAAVFNRTAPNLQSSTSAPWQQNLYGKNAFIERTGLFY